MISHSEIGYNRQISGEKNEMKLIFKIFLRRASWHYYAHFMSDKSGKIDKGNHRA